jgi:xanthine dehydrogenase accessory factor
VVRFPLAARLGQCCGGVATLAFTVIARDNGAWLETAVAREREGAAMDLVTVIGGGARSFDSWSKRRPRSRARRYGRHDDARRPHHRSDDFSVLVFGNGHVGRALVQVLGVLPARVRWIDAREADFAADVPAGVEIVSTDVPTAELRDAPCGSLVVITTHDHALDFELVCAALARDDFGYIGLIGSVSKRNQFEKRLLARGYGAAQMTRITCPIGRGVPVRSKHPGAIAIAVATELLAVREARGQRAQFESVAR